MVFPRGFLPGKYFSAVALEMTMEWGSSSAVRGFPSRKGNEKNSKKDESAILIPF
jgi:hypothetical protein